LARRAFASRDLRRRLLLRQHTVAAVDGALARLAQRGYLDDARFALDYARQRARRGRGPARLLRDLLTQGVERRMAEQAIERALRDEAIEPREVARQIAQTRAHALRALPPDTRRRRLAAFLARRGFTGPAITDLLAEVVSRA
jgi:regulatory protein